MTPENWPEPIGRVEELHSLDAVHIHVEPMPDVGETIYTATQVREIVRMEVEAARKAIRNQVLGLTTLQRMSGDMLDFAVDVAARKWLKENKDAD